MSQPISDSAVFTNTYLPEGQLLSLPRNRETLSSLQGLERAMHTGIILEGMAYLCDSDMNLHIDLPALSDVRAVIPAEEVVFPMSQTPVKDIAILTRVGKAVCFKVLGMTREDGHWQIKLSRRAAQAECINHYLSSLCPGDIIPAKVTHMETFGAFVDIGCGISSLLSVDTISVSRISRPQDRLYNGQLIRTVVKNIERDIHGFPRRIFVSMRELLGTWEENASCFRAGQTVAGIIRSVEPYGIFVELTPNLAGLAEVKEDACPEIRSPTLVGKRATVYIKSILPERMKIKLVLIDTYAEDPSAPPSLTYYIPPEAEHLSHWHYSTPTAHKQIFSVFDPPIHHP